MYYTLNMYKEQELNLILPEHDDDDDDDIKYVLYMLQNSSVCNDDKCT
jgi:hypothetical protein